MSPEAQRSAIAEACGWKLVQFEGANSSFYEHPSRPSNYTFKRLPKPGPILPDNRGLSDHDQLSTWGVPDYLSDLNAMHEAEEVLTEDQQYKYVALLVGKDWSESWSFTNAAKAIRATAAQRAQVFLRTLGLWKE